MKEKSLVGTGRRVEFLRLNVSFKHVSGRTVVHHTHSFSINWLIFIYTQHAAFTVTLKWLFQSVCVKLKLLQWGFEKTPKTNW